MSDKRVIIHPRIAGSRAEWFQLREFWKLELVNELSRD